MGCSTWILENVGGIPGHHITFYFYSIPGSSCEHRLYMHSDCTAATVTYKTQNTCMNCPGIDFLTYVDYPINYIGCDPAQYTADWVVFQLFAAGDSGGYCLEPPFYDKLIFSMLGVGQALSWVSGHREIWFL